MFLNGKTSPTGVPPTAGPIDPDGPRTTGHPPPRPPLQGHSLGLGAMSLIDAVDTAVVGPRHEPYALMERVFDGLGAVKDVLAHLPPVGSVGTLEFAQALGSAFQGLDLGRVIRQLHRLANLRGDVDREGLRKLEKALVGLKQVVDDLQAAPAGPGALGETIAELEGQLTGALSSLETAMTANLAEAWMATSRSGIEVPASETLPMAVHHGMESLQTILDKALEAKDHQGGFEAFMRLRRDLQQFDLFELGQHLASGGLDVRAEILDLLTLVATTGDGWDDKLDMTWVENRWDSIEAAIGKLAMAFQTAGSQPPEAIVAVKPPALPDDADGVIMAGLLHKLDKSMGGTSATLKRIAKRFLEPGSCAKLGRVLGDKAHSIGKWAIEAKWILDTGSEMAAVQFQQRLALELTEIGFISRNNYFASSAPSSQDHWDSKAVARTLGDALRAVKKRGALGEANIWKAVTYLENMLSGIDIHALAAHPDLAGFLLLHHLGRLEKAVAYIREAYMSQGWGPDNYPDVPLMHNSIRILLRALTVAGIIPEEVLPAFFDGNWPSVPGIAFDPYPPFPRTRAEVMELVADAVQLGGFDPDIPGLMARWISPPDDLASYRWAPALKQLQKAVILARQSGLPVEHQRALLHAIEVLLGAAVPVEGSRQIYHMFEREDEKEEE